MLPRSIYRLDSSENSSRKPQNHRNRKSHPPVTASFASKDLTIAAGVAIFHVSSGRVVLCFHTRDRYWFLPKGRRDAGEESGRGAEREGYEESGYRNRLLPLPLPHRQPAPHGPDPSVPQTPFSTEPVWTQLLPLSLHVQYILFWYIAETLPPDIEADMNARNAPPDSGIDSFSASSPLFQSSQPYRSPPPYPPDLPLKYRMRMDPADYEPIRHENTGVDEEEALYTSLLVPIDEAIEKLRGSVMSEVVRNGWDGIMRRLALEEEIEMKKAEEPEICS